MSYIGTSYASLDGTSTTTIIVAEDDRKKYGLRDQSGVGDITTAKFRTLKGARAFLSDRLSTGGYRIIARVPNYESKAKRPVYDWVIKYDYHDYEKRMLSTPLTEHNEFFPPE